MVACDILITFVNCSHQCIAAVSAHRQSTLISWAHPVILQCDRLVWAHCGRDGQNGPIHTHHDYDVDPTGDAL